MNDQSSPRTLVIRSAPVAQLREYLAAHPEKMTTLFSAVAENLPSGIPLLEVPQGPMTRQLIRGKLRAILLESRWDEVVVLRNADLRMRYTEIFRMIETFAGDVPIRVRYADGRERTFATIRDCLRLDRGRTCFDLITRPVMEALFVTAIPVVVGWTTVRWIVRAIRRQSSAHSTA